MKKLLFVFNPHAGKGQIKFHLLQILDTFTKAGYEVTAHPTQAKLDAVNVITETGKDHDVIVVSGGDGTMNEAIRGLMNIGEKIPLGYIPAGTMNDFASSLGIPHNMTAAAEKIVTRENPPRSISALSMTNFSHTLQASALLPMSATALRSR